MRVTGKLSRMYRSEKYSGQKHQSMLPTEYIYRKEKKAGRPGYTVLKSFNTLGCHPSGLEVPYRLNDFKNNYLKEHMPLEYEDWLHMVAQRHPMNESLVRGLELYDLLKRTYVPLPSALDPYPMISNIRDLTRAFNAFLLSFPEQGSEDNPRAPVAVSARTVRQTVYDYHKDVEEVVKVYCEIVPLLGSTPHRRLGYGTTTVQLPPHLTTSGDDALLAHDSDATLPSPTTSAAKHFIQSKPIVPDSLIDIKDDVTYEDELLLLYLHNICAQSAYKSKEYEEAVQLLERSLPLARDDQRLAKVQCDIATCELKMGKFEASTRRARQSVLLADDPRGYAIWSLSKAYNEQTDDALQIAARALENQPSSVLLKQTLHSLQRHAVGRVNSTERRRWHAQYTAALGEHHVPFVEEYPTNAMSPATSHHWMWFRGPLGPFYRYDPRGW